MRSAGYHLPSLASSVETEAYAKVAVASSKVRFLPSFFLKGRFVVFSYFHFLSGDGSF